MTVELYNAIKGNGNSLYIYNVSEIKMGLMKAEILTINNEHHEVEVDNISRIYS